jgi:hypothetical protein
MIKGTTILNFLSIATFLLLLIRWHFVVVELWVGPLYAGDLSSDV